MKFITVLNGTITGCHDGDINADFFGSPYYGHERVEIPEAASYPATLTSVTYYDADWTRKTDRRLVDARLMPMPAGYKWEGDNLVKMDGDERIIAGIDPPRKGTKVADGAIVPATPDEQLAMQQITLEEYDRSIVLRNEGEFASRLAALTGDEARARAEVDTDYAAERKVKITAILAVKQQEGWPLSVNWPA
jgi:hypothetical protein